MPPTPQLPDYTVLPEPRLLFDPRDPAKADVHPLRGLATHGPYSSSALASMPDTVRLALIVPNGGTNVANRVVDQVVRPQTPSERLAYLPPWPGFEAVFGRRLVVAPAAAIELPTRLDADIATCPTPQRAAAEAIAAALRQIELVRAEWDVVLIYLPTRWERAFTGGTTDDFDLHDFIKANTASLGQPSQVLNDDVIRYRCRASVGWRLGIALYTKAGGVPWKMEPVEPETAYVGLSYAIDRTGGSTRFIRCCSQIFDADGVGLEFLLYQADPSKVHFAGKNPFLSRDQMREVMASSLALYIDRHAGRFPRRVVVHKNTEFKFREIDGAFDALARVDEVELVQVQETRWRAVRLLAPRTSEARSEADRYPLYRGSMAVIGEQELLLWTQGNASAVTGGVAWYPEGKGIPRPLLLRRFAGRADASVLAREVLALSKMDWNNDALYDTLPGTLAFAHKLAEVVKRMPTLDRRPYALRMFM